MDTNNCDRSSRMGSLAMLGRLGRFALLAVVLLTPSVALAQDRPHAFYLLIDVSASMTEVPKKPQVPEDWKDTKLAEVKRQLGDFCASLPVESEVRVFTFANEVRESLHVELVGNQQRSQLRALFAGLEAKGTETHLWDSLGFVLEKASQAVSATPGKSVRLLVYTDGEENSPDPPDPEKILEPYQTLIKERVRVTYVSLGFTLRSEVQEVFARYSIRVSPAPQRSI